jgi:hypothetical protein
MVTRAPDDDDTVRVRPSVAKQNARSTKVILIAGGIALAVGGAALALIGMVAFGTIAGNRQPPIQIDTETEAQIDATNPCATKISRLALDPDIVVIDFPTLTEQGLTLNRVAALIEKANLPRDRVLDDVDLNQAIYDCGDTIESYYYGHDYKAADLAKFFTLADADHIQLNPHEVWLKSLLTQLGWLAGDSLAPNANGAIITLPAAVPPIDPHMRAVILHHEISHGAFYTIPAYAAYATNFWTSLSPQDQAAFTGFLGRQGYDTSNTELMLNETQAYLIFTRDPLFFNAAAVGMTKAHVAALRASYIPAIPVSWLAPMANEALPVGPGRAATCPATG